MAFLATLRDNHATTYLVSTTREYSSTRPYLLERVPALLGSTRHSTFTTRLDSLLDFLVLDTSLLLSGK